MNFIDKIINICSNNADKIDTKDENYHRATLLNYYSFISIILFLISGMISFFSKNHILLFSIVLLLVIISVNYFVFKSKSNYHLAANILTVSLSVFFVWLIYSGVTINQGILFYAAFPPLVIHLLGKKNGNIASVIFFTIVVISIFLPNIIDLSFQYNLSNQLLFVLIYVALFVFINIHENIIEFRFNELNKKVQEAKSETLAKEEFISKISHQIRTPLNNIVVVSNLVNSSDIDEKLKDLIDTIQASTNNLVNVVNNIAELSNVDLLQSKDYNQNFNIETTVKNTINLFSNEDSNNINFPLNISEDINYQLFGDPVKIKQVFLNLLENTIKNSKSGIKTISIDINKISESGENTELQFLVSTKDLTNISEVTKIRNTEKTKKGKKDAFVKLLELHIANRIIESLGGQIEIEITPDNFEFKFSLKFRKGELFADEFKISKDSTLPDIEAGEKVTLKDANILLVEDNLINQKIVLLSLKKSVKSVDVANNGKEALDKFGSVKYDIILMDIQMPIMNGIVTTKKIRSIEKSTNSHTPIIAITANALLGDKEECLAAGMDDYISKPFQIETLITKMEKQLS